MRSITDNRVHVLILGVVLVISVFCVTSSEVSANLPHQEKIDFRLEEIKHLFLDINKEHYNNKQQVVLYCNQYRGNNRKLVTPDYNYSLPQ